MKIAVIGANGQLGSDAVAAFSQRGDEVSALTHQDIAIENADFVASCLGALKPDVVINTAAMHHVENCEQQADKAYGVNAIGARNLAMVTRDLGSKLIHISTDYVFDGSKGKPYLEQDAPLPLNVYGNTKLAGEHYVRAINPKHFVLRVSAIYGKSPCRAKGGLNFVELMLKLARERGKVRVVDSEFVSPTSTAEIAEQLVKVSDSDAYGLYHATAEGSCSWWEYAREIFAQTNTQVVLEAAGPNEFPAKVPRPRYSVLENAGLKAQGMNVFRPWQDGLLRYLGQTQPASVTVPA
jgi:dTDP-4-dehydrorhamnose reductase